MTTFLKNVLKFDKLSKDNSYHPEETIDNLIAEYYNGPKINGQSEGYYSGGGGRVNPASNPSHTVSQLMKSDGCLFAVIETSQTESGLRLEEKMRKREPVDFRLSFVTDSENTPLLKRNKVVTVRKITKATIVSCTAIFPVI